MIDYTKSFNELSLNELSEIIEDMTPNMSEDEREELLYWSED